MREALYSPRGYYRGGGRISASGDYFTAPSAHPGFGALIALQLRDLWNLSGNPGEFTVIELGAGDGLLARDITQYAAQIDPEFASAIDYLAFDEVPETSVHYKVLPPSGLPEGMHGCVISNELLDAMPVHRFVVQKGRVLELYIGVDGDELVEEPGEPSTPALEQRAGPFAAALPNGYRGEVNLEIEPWAGKVSKTLETGHVITIDYGFERRGLYSSSRISGSLRCYYRHTLSQDPLSRVGLQDITAHVDFTAVGEALGSMGFQRVGQVSQAEFLSNLGIAQWTEELRRSNLGELEKRSNMAGLQKLVDPAGLGGFIVDVHGRGVDDGPVRALGEAPGNPIDGPLPLLRDYPGHVDLTGGTPSAGQWFEVQSFEHLFSDDP
jgi:SAM-dependent MidA family methyltransferase